MAPSMNGDLELCAAAFFRGIGKDVATTDEFVNGVSLVQKWMPPSSAKKLLSLMASAGVVTVRDGYVRPRADLPGMDVPLAYRPPKDILTAQADVPAPEKKDVEKKSEDVFPQLMSAAVEAGMQRRTFIQECNRIQQRLDIDVCAAALFVMRDAGIDIGPLVEKVYSRIAESRFTPA